MSNEKDHYEKKLEDYDDVFADIVNVLLFHGETQVREDALETGMSRSSYRVEGRFEEQERDAKKFWKQGRVRIAVFGMENQTGEDGELVFREFGYDGADYRDQVRAREEARRKNARIRKATPPGEEPAYVSVPAFYPVVTLALYFGDKRWKSPLSLKGQLSIPPGLEEYVQDYRVNLFEIAYLSDEQVGMFRSDFRFVAEYFTGRRKMREGLLPEFHYPLEKMRHVEAVMDLMNALTASDRFSMLPTLYQRRGNEAMMTDILDWYEAKGEAKGEARGKAIGERKLSQLMRLLLKEKDYAALERVSEDQDYRMELYDKYAIQG